MYHSAGPRTAFLTRWRNLSDGRQKFVSCRFDLLYEINTVGFLKSYCRFLIWGSWIRWKCENTMKVHTKCISGFLQVLKKGSFIVISASTTSVNRGYSGKLDYSLYPLVTLSVGLYHMKGLKITLFKNVLGLLYIKEYWAKTNSCHYTFDNSVLNLKLVTSI